MKYRPIDLKAHEVIGEVDGLRVSTGEKLLGRDCPPYQVDVLACLSWWAEYRARIRYIEADAMIKAKEATPATSGGQTP